VSLSLDMVAAIDARIAAVLKQQTAWGTVAAIRGQVDADVTFDGSAQAVPVKLSGDVWCYEGDRVALVAIGPRPWWTIVAVMTRHWQPYSATMVVQAFGTTTSGTLTDLPTTAEVTVVKRWDETKLAIHLDLAGAFSSVANTSGIWGVRITPTAGAATTLDVVETPFNATERESTGGVALVAGLPADTYIVRVLWRRNVGTGAITVDAFSRAGIQVAEVSPT
jgi:hypothetical protein